MVNLAIELLPGHKRGLALSNPVMTASGTFANGLEYARVFDIQRLGAIVSKAITLKPRRGNPQPRVVETAAGMLNSIGLQNIGIDAILQDVAPIWATWRVPVIANIAGESIAHYVELARRLDGVPGISGIEMNVSCPNVESGLDFGVDPRAAAEVTHAVRHQTRSEEHTSELQSRGHLVCRLLLEKKKNSVYYAWGVINKSVFWDVLRACVCR